MKPLRVLVAEDEAVIARRLARMTADILAPRPCALAMARSLDDARAAIATAPPDILILDLNLEGEEGFALLREPVIRRCPTVVVSAHTDRALEAFEHGVRDFVAKPFGRARLELALRRALDATPPAGETADYVGVRTKSGTAFVPVEEIVYVRGAGTRSKLVLTGGRIVQHERMLDRLERLLPSQFLRIHKSLIVDIRRIERFIAEEGSRYAVLLRDGTMLPVGRTRVAAMRQRLY